MIRQGTSYPSKYITPWGPQVNIIHNKSFRQSLSYFHGQLLDQNGGSGHESDTKSSSTYSIVVLLNLIFLNAIPVFSLIFIANYSSTIDKLHVWQARNLITNTDW